MANDTHTMLHYEAAKKSTGIAYLLWFFFGSIGGHRFYLGRTGSAVGMLVLLVLSALFSIVGIGLFGFLALVIWLIIDAFLIPGIVSEFNTNLVQSLAK